MLSKPLVLSLIFFSLIFFIGVFIFRDYGIGWDEQDQRLIGLHAYDYVIGENDKIFESRNKFYGTAFELPLVVFENILSPREIRDIFFIRHFFTFLLLFLSLICFYFLARIRFNNPWIALLPPLFLVLSPRIFADSFYNSKDLAFLSATIIGVYVLIRFFKKPTFISGTIFAIASAFLIDIRVTGVFLPLIAVFIFFIAWFSKNKDIKEGILPFLFYLVLLVFLTISFWPFLWKSPLNNFMAAFNSMSRFTRWDGEVLFLGKFIKADELPWYYAPVWILITTPFSYIILFLVGIFQSIYSLVRKPKKDEYYLNLIFILWFFGPLFAVILFGSVLYDGWRQLYFIYPALIMLAVSGVQKIKTLRSPIVYTAVIIIAVNLFFVVFFMVKNHPYQNLYFNFLAGGMENAKKNFDMDYWGLSYRKGLEWIAENDKSKVIPVFFSYGNMWEIEVVKAKDMNRFFPSDSPQKAKYILSNYRWHPEEYPSTLNEVYSVKIDNVKVMTVIKVH